MIKLSIQIDPFQHLMDPEGFLDLMGFDRHRSGFGVGLEVGGEIS